MGRVRKRMMPFAASIAVTIGLPVGDGMAQELVSATPDEWALRIDGGGVSIEFDPAALADLGLQIISRGESAGSAEDGSLTFAIDPASTLQVKVGAGAPFNADGGVVATQGALMFVQGPHRAVVGNLTFGQDGAGGWSGRSKIDDLAEPAFHLADIMIDAAGGKLRLFGELVLAAPLAAKLGIPHAGGTILGAVMIDAALQSTDPAVSPLETIQPAEDSGGVAGNSIGPDVIVGSVDPIVRWARVGNITAYSIGGTSCNIGNVDLNWIANQNQHPVIAQNMYRLKDGRFEQIGLSWLKHGFYALSGNLCSGAGGCSGDPNGRHLGVGCSDPYSASLNGAQSNLGPRAEVNATTGFYPYPFGGAPYNGALARRLQVHDNDLEPAVNANSLYFAEIQYVTPDDAAAGNQNNNASYRRFTINEQVANEFDAVVTGPTARQMPAIQAWGQADPFVTIVNIDVPDDRRLILGYRAAPGVNNTWEYEYAIQNLNSHRSVGAFIVPVPAGIALTRIGFHDVHDHSGSPYSTADWATSNVDGKLTWATETYRTNPNANALRWGSLYNFRFVTDTPPVLGEVTIELFRPGTVSDVTVAALVPGPHLSLTSSDPSDGAIDARQPYEVDGTNPAGWQQIDVSFSGNPAALTPASFSVTGEGGMGQTPEIYDVIPLDADTVTIYLTGPIEVGAWTRFTYSATGESVRIGYLPGDVNGDGTSGARDILALVDALNNVGDARPIWSTDVNRSGVPGSTDILREVDLLNGAGEYDVYNDAALPR